MGLPFGEPTRLTNIRDFRIECSSGNKAEVRRCAHSTASLAIPPMGRNAAKSVRGGETSQVVAG